MAEGIEKPPLTHLKSSRFNVARENQLKFETKFSEWARMKCQDSAYIERFRRCIFSYVTDDSAPHIKLYEPKKLSEHQFLDAGFAKTVPNLVVETADNDDHFFEYDDDTKRKHIYQTLRPNMILMGYLTVSIEGNWSMDVKGVLEEKSIIFSDMDLLNIKATCPKAFLSDGLNDPLSEKFRGGIFVKAMVVSVPENHKSPILVSFTTNSVRLPWTSRRHCLGYNQEEERETSEYKSYNSLLREDKSFHNPSSMLAITQYYKIRDDLSLLEICDFKDQGIEELRSKQSIFWALDLVSMGRAYYDQKDSRALEVYKEAMNLDPKCVPAYMGVATIYYQKGLFLEAYKYIKRILKLEPDNQKAQQGLAKVEEKIRSCRRHTLTDGRESGSHCQEKDDHHSSSQAYSLPDEFYSSPKRQFSRPQRESDDPLMNLKPTKRASFYQRDGQAIGASRKLNRDSGSRPLAHQDGRDSNPHWLTDTNVMVPDIDMIGDGRDVAASSSSVASYQEKETSRKIAHSGREREFPAHNEHYRESRKQMSRYDDQRKYRWHTSHFEERRYREDERQYTHRYYKSRHLHDYRDRHLRTENGNNTNRPSSSKEYCDPEHDESRASSDLSHRRSKFRHQQYSSDRDSLSPPHHESRSRYHEHSSHSLRH
ncbi:uncharacterized protein LOC126325931 [Schistocerca gregaria]|uniref:uncharacterized protein LOC126325931 n=1 Tax=Schistocerca gregaria TaxID=7010 RepID=UPI00211E6E75|nr:uncharacterized protein LOC126325931 [Schistocerca gregaria]